MIRIFKWFSYVTTTWKSWLLCPWNQNLPQNPKLGDKQNNSPVLKYIYKTTYKSALHNSKVQYQGQKDEEGKKGGIRKVDPSDSSIWNIFLIPGLVPPLLPLKISKWTNLGLNNEYVQVIARCQVQYGKYFTILSRSSRPEVFCKKGVLKNFTKFKENTCARVSFFIKLQAWGLHFY